MEINQSRDGQTAILSVAGRIDTLTAPVLTEQAVNLCDTGIRGVLLDMQSVEYMSSAGFRALLMVRRRTQQGAIGLALCGLNALLDDLFEVSGLHGIFRIYSDRAAALAAIGNKDPV